MTIKFLIVDDDEASLKILTKNIDASALGQPTQIFWASTWPQALEISESEKPHLTFADACMKGRELQKTLDTILKMTRPIIVTTGLSTDYTRPGQPMTFMAECYVAGAEDYIVKGSERYDAIQDIALRTVLRKYASNNGPR